MVQGLAFLSKKSWHTKNLANQEKVWMAEQRKEAEAQKTKELAKQIQQEREQEELDTLSGKKSSTLDRGIDWMYQGGKTGDLAKEDAEKRAEEFLLGKEYVGEGASHGDFDQGDTNAGIHNVLGVAQKPSAFVETTTAAPTAPAVQYHEPSVKDRNESFRLRVEDPMFSVSQKQHEKKIKHDKNKALYQRVVGYGEEKQERGFGENKEDRKKSHKKDRKKHDKSRRSKRSHEDDENDRRKRRRRHRSPSSGSDAERHARRRRQRSRSRSRSSNSECSRDDDYDRKKRNKDEHFKRSERRRSSHHRDQRRGASNPNDSENSDKGRLRRRPDENLDRTSQGRRKHNHHREESPDRLKKSRIREPEPASLPTREEGYGLQGGIVSSLETGDLGPKKELLQKKREEREAERRRIRETASSRRRTTEEERAKALEEMQANARQRDLALITSTQQRKGYNNEDEEPSRGNASFLKDIAQQTHGVGHDSASLSARVAQNRHTNQRLHDSFL